MGSPGLSSSDHGPRTTVLGPLSFNKETKMPNNSQTVIREMSRGLNPERHRAHQILVVAAKEQAASSIKKKISEED